MSGPSPSTPPPLATLLEAKQYLRERFEEGAECPCCNQLVKRYRRKLTSSMAYALVMIYRHFRRDGIDEWLHVPSYLDSLGASPLSAANRGGDWAKLKFWLFIEKKPEGRADGSPRSGYWKITDYGRQFARNESVAPSHVFLYNQKVVQGEDSRVKLIAIKDALGERFNYDQLMRGGGYGF